MSFKKRVYRPKRQVISVGNIALGGSGKTPMVMWLARELYRRNFTPIIIMRGYGGRILGPIIVEDSFTTLDVGDEAKMVFHHFQRDGIKVKVVIGRSKKEAVKWYEERFKLIKGEGARREVFIIDDGHQHVSLARDLNILLLDVSSKRSINRLLTGWPLPFGLLRESLTAGLNRADIVFFSLRGSRKVENEPFLSLRTKVAKFQLRTFSSNVKVKALSFFKVTCGDDLFPQVKPLEENTRQVIAFSGIAGGEVFTETLRSIGYEVLKSFRFGDHHRFTREELDKLLKIGEKLGAGGLVCTEKDFVKVKEVWGGMNGVIGYSEVAMEVLENKSDEFIEEILRDLG